jgi:hypothetical protein
MRIRLLSIICFSTCQAVAAVELPRGEPPTPALKKINVADFGAVLADDEHDDTESVNKAIRAADDNTTLYFPAGTYNVRWVDEIKYFDGLSIQGDGPRSSIIKRMGPYWKNGDTPTFENLRKNYATDCKLLRIADCRDMCIRDIGFDAHGTPTFGGVGIQRPKRLHITQTRIFDSKEQPPLFDRDRFGWVILGYDQAARDVWFTHNVVAGLQTEFDSVTRVLVEHCHFLRPVKSAGLAFLSANFSEGKGMPGYHNTHITVRHCYFTHPNDLSMGMLAVQLDPPGNCNTVFSDMQFLDNIFVYAMDSQFTSPAIKLGAGDSSVKTTGNVFDRIRIERNHIYRDPKTTLNEDFHGYIWYNCRAGEDRLNYSHVRGNRLFTERKSPPTVAINRQDESLQLVVEQNEIEDFQSPPRPSESP